MNFRAFYIYANILSKRFVKSHYRAELLTKNIITIKYTLGERTKLGRNRFALISTQCTYTFTQNAHDHLIRKRLFQII